MFVTGVCTEKDYAELEDKYTGCFRRNSEYFRRW
jgi:hypothetical protein